MENTKLITALTEVLYLMDNNKYFKHDLENQENYAEWSAKYGISHLAADKRADVSLHYDLFGSYAKNPACILGDVIRALKNEVALKETKAKNNNAAAQHRVIKNVLKYAQRHNVNPDFSQTHIINGKQFVCDAYRLIAFAKTDNTFEICDHKTSFDMEKVINDNKHNEYNGKEITAPDKQLLKVYIAECKARKERYPKYHFGDVVVNASYLYDVLDAMPGVKLYMNSASNGYILPIYCKDDNDNEAILLPVRPDVLSKDNNGKEVYALGEEYKTQL